MILDEKWGRSGVWFSAAPFALIPSVPPVFCRPAAARWACSSGSENLPHEMCVWLKISLMKCFDNVKSRS